MKGIITTQITIVKIKESQRRVMSFTVSRRVPALSVKSVMVPAEAGFGKFKLAQMKMAKAEPSPIFIAWIK